MNYMDPSRVLCMLKKLGEKDKNYFKIVDPGYCTGK